MQRWSGDHAGHDFWGNLHCGWRRSDYYTSPLATHLALYIDSIQDAVDAIIVTGDLATTGSEVDLSTAKAFFFANTPIPPVARVKLNLRIPVIFLPGNHDRF